MWPLGSVAPVSPPGRVLSSLGSEGIGPPGSVLYGETGTTPLRALTGTRVHVFIQRTLPVRLPPALWQVPQGTTGSLTSCRPQAGDGRQGTSALTRQMYNLMSGGN